MKIYTNNLTEADVRGAFAKAREDGADIYAVGLRTWQPRDYSRGIEVFAESLHGKYATGHRPVGSYPLDCEPRAASWDDWGLVMAYLFNIDPHARIGFYDSEADFVEKVRKYRRKDSDLAFLKVLTNIAEYGDE
jgi:hypothetical protein